MGRHLLNSFASEDPERFASMLESTEDFTEMLSILAEIDEGLESRVVACLPPELANRLLNQVSDSMLTAWLDTGQLDAGRRLLSRVSQERAARLIESVNDRSKRRAMRRLAAYTSGSIGQLTQAHMASVRDDAAYTDIIAQIQRFKGSLEGPVAIERHDGTVLGVLDFSRLTQNLDQNATAADFCIPVKPLFADAPLPSMSSLTRSAKWARLTSIPVVDHKKRLVGYVTRAALENAVGSERESNLFLESMIELVKQYWDFMLHALFVILGRSIRS